MLMQNQLKQLRSELYDLMEELIKEKLDRTTEQVQSIETAKQGETKSTAGDKHETSRALLQAEEDQLKTQLKKNKALLVDLDTCRRMPMAQTISKGSIIQTNQSIILISLGMGNLKHKGKNYVAISPQAPLGKALLGKKPGDNVEFMNTVYQIIAIA